MDKNLCAEGDHEAAEDAGDRLVEAEAGKLVSPAPRVRSRTRPARQPRLCVDEAPERRKRPLPRSEIGLRAACSRSHESRIVDIAFGALPVEGLGPRLVQRRARPDALGKVGIGDE